MGVITRGISVMTLLQNDFMSGHVVFAETVYPLTMTTESNLSHGDSPLVSLVEQVLLGHFQPHVTTHTRTNSCSTVPNSTSIATTRAHCDN